MAAAAVAAAEAAAAVEAAAAAKADKAEKADDSDESSMSDAEVLPEVELAALGEAGAATAGQAGLPCGVLPVVDAVPVATAPPVVVPVAEAGFGLSPLLLGALGLGALGLGLLLFRDKDDDDGDGDGDGVGGTPNQPPVAANDVDTVDEDDTTTGDVSLNDNDPDNLDEDLTYTLNEDVDGLTLNEDGTYTFDASDPAYDDIGAGETRVVVAEYTVTDPAGGEDTATLTITITGQNVAPVASDDVVAAVEDGPPVTGQADAVDADGDPLTFELVDPVDGLTLNEDGTYTFDPSDPAYNDLGAGETRVVVAEFTATDPSGASDTGTITITVTGTNDAPVITSGATGNVDENAPPTTVVYDAEATDPDGDPVTFALAGEDAADFTINPTTGEVRLIVPADFETQQTYNIVIVATDPLGAVDTQPVVITVNDVAEPAAQSLDDDPDSNPATPNVITVPADTNVNFADDAAVASNTTLVGFDCGDVIATDTTGTITFANTGTDDLTITITEGGTVSTIVLQDAVLTTDVITDEATAEEALGCNFFLNTAGGGTLTALDSDNGGPLTVSAAGGNFAFFDNAHIESDATITGDVAAGDTLALNADPANVTFANENGDLVVTTTEDGVTSTVTLEDAVAVDAVVTDEATAEVALGNIDFFQFA